MCAMSRETVPQFPCYQQETVLAELSAPECIANVGFIQNCTDVSGVLNLSLSFLNINIQLYTFVAKSSM